jgi:hypothetical protein
MARFNKRPSREMWNRTTTRLLRSSVGGAQFLRIRRCSSATYGPKSASSPASIPARPPPPPGEPLWLYAPVPPLPLLPPREPPPGLPPPPLLGFPAIILGPGLPLPLLPEAPEVLPGFLTTGPPPVIDGLGGAGVLIVGAIGLGGILGAALATLVGLGNLGCGGAGVGAGCGVGWVACLG